VPEPPPGPEETLADAFRSVSRQLRIRTQQALAPWGVTPSQARALGVLARHGRMRLGALAEHLRVAPRSATDVADDLGVAGLAVRTEDPADRRAVLIECTERGRATAEGIRAARAAEADDFFARLDDTDRAALTQILHKLRA
jgi:DNA-binding MarR family transcriptional regulator